MNLYMIVTNDRYELPVKCGLSAGEAAEFLGGEARPCMEDGQEAAEKVKIQGSGCGEIHPR